MSTLGRSNITRHVRTSLLFFAGAAALFTSAPAYAEFAITQPSPFANCTADNVAGQAGTNFPNAEVEPWLAANPDRPRQLVAGWQQDRWSNGGSRGLASAYSRDGGVTWNNTVPQGTTVCAGGPFTRASDPWTTISPDGTAYFMSLGFMNDEPCGDQVLSGDNAMTVNRSRDGGKTWGPVQNLVLDTDGQLFNDKNAMLADPDNERFVYGVWDKLVDFTVPSECPAVTGGAAAKKSVKSGDGHDGVAKARDRRRSKIAAASSRKSKNGWHHHIPKDPPSPKPSAYDDPNASYTGPTYFVRTVNGGRSWRPERLIFDPGSDAQTINNLIEVLPNRTVAVFFTHILADGSIKLGLAKSQDRGATFKVNPGVFDMNVTLNGTQTPDAKEPVRDANVLFDTAVDRENGNIYIVWQDGREGGLDRIAFAVSKDNGNTFSEPVIINKTPASANPLRNQAFIPSVEVGKNHKVYVTYYDFRNDVDNGKETTDYWAISCNPHRGDNCLVKSGWGKEQRLTTTSFDMLDAPVARGHFLGDYQGLVAAGRSVKSVFGKAVSDNVNDMFFTELGRHDR
jgi:hypothetical protein